MKKLIFLFLMLLFIFPHIGFSADKSLRVHFIDVGQGDSMLIETPEDRVILIDGGEPDQGKRLVGYLNQLGVKEIDLMVATHPDFDHIGGLVEVLKQFPVKKVMENGELHPTRTYAAYRLQLLKENIPVQVVREKDKIAVEEKIELHVLHAATSGAENTNQSSIVLKLTYDEVDFLLMSDVEAEQERRIAEKYDVDSEVLKVAHHGSSSSSMLSFLRQVNPEVSIISYEKNNDYGHPVERVIHHLQRAESQIFSTAAYGDIIVETDGKEYIVIPDMQPMERLIKEVR